MALLGNLSEKIHLMNPEWQPGWMSGPTLPTYKTRNWPSYNEALKRCGSLSFWFDSAMTVRCL